MFALAFSSRLPAWPSPYFFRHFCRNVSHLQQLTLLHRDEKKEDKWPPTIFLFFLYGDVLFRQLNACQKELCYSSSNLFSLCTLLPPRQSTGSVEDAVCSRVYCLDTPVSFVCEGRGETEGRVPSLDWGARISRSFGQSLPSMSCCNHRFLAKKNKKQKNKNKK